MYIDNREEVLKVVREYGRMLNYASDDLKGDEEIVLEALKQDQYSLMYASDEIKNNKKFVLEIVGNSYSVLRYCLDKCELLPLNLKVLKELRNYSLE